MKKLVLTFLMITGYYNMNFAQTNDFLTEGSKKIATKSEVNVDSSKFWKTGGVIALNFTQSSFNNWAAGGQNSLSLNALVSVFAYYKKDKIAWDNSLDLGYGFLKQGKNGSLIKTDDKIDFASKLGRNANKNWYYTALLNFKTQGTPGYNYPNDSVKISDLLAPAYLLGALGMDYKPSDHFSLFIAPATYKMTIVNNQTLADAGAFGVEKATYDASGVLLTAGETVRSEFGGYLKMVIKHDLFKEKNVSFLTKLELFSNYANNPENLDVNWETVIGFKVTKYISATFSASLVYDDDIQIALDRSGDGIIDGSGPRTQFKEILSIGLNYKF